MIKGIETRKNRSGEMLYRASTHVNNKKVHSSWTLDQGKAVCELEKFTRLRTPHVGQNKITKANNDITLRELIDIFLVETKSQYAENSLVNYRNELRLNLAQFLTMRISQVTDHKAVTDSFHGIKKTTAKHYIATISTLRKFAKAKDYPFTLNTEAMYLAIKQLPASVDQIKFLNGDEVSAMFNFLRGDGKTVRQQKRLEHFRRAAVLALYNGLRVGEVLALRYGDVNFQNKMLTVRSTKVGSVPKSYKKGTKNTLTRTIPLSEHSLEVLKLFDPNTNPNDLLFTETHTWICRNMNRLGKNRVINPDYTFHTLRHTFASLFFSLKGTTHDCLLKLQQIMGHSDLQMTLKYVHLYDNMSGNVLDGLTFGETDRLRDARVKKEHDDRIEISQPVSVKKSGDTLYVRMPFNKQANVAIEAIGKWVKPKKYWEVPRAQRDIVYAILKTYFGFTGKKQQKIRKQIALLQKKLLR